LLTETEGYNVTYRGAYPLSQDEYERFRESTAAEYSSISSAKDWVSPA